MVQAKLKTLDALPSLLNKVTNDLNQFAQAIASKKTEDTSIPSAGQAGTQPAKGRKNTKSNQPSHKDENSDEHPDYFKANKRLKSPVQYEDHLPDTVLNELVLGMIMFNSYHRQDFITIEDLKDFSNTMLYTIQEIFFKLHQGPGLDNHARTFSTLLLSEIDKRNLNPLKQIRTIKQLRQIK
ncbi:hypothetical protein Tco_1391982 [Tanacetum coccineum]